MAFDITVYIGNNGETTSLYKKGRLVMYRKLKGTWEVVKERDFSIKKSWGILELRNKMREVLEFLGECKIFVGQSLSGLPYFMLEKEGCNVWEFEGQPIEFLDYILEKEEEESLSIKDPSSYIPLPEEIKPGCFYISLKEIQENNNGITSKQVIMPFLKKGEFQSLEIICNHIPPWLENDLILGDLKKETEVIGHNEVKLRLFRE